mgnify:CR=1 FL=1
MNLWLLFTLAATLLTAIERILHRYVLRNNDDASIYTLAYQFAAAMFLVPTILVEFKDYNFSPAHIPNYILLIISGIFWLGFGLLSFHADRYAQVSITSILSRTRLFWVLLIGLVFFDEVINSYTVGGIIFIFIGITILAFISLGGNRGVNKGALFSLMAAISISIALSIDKYQSQSSQLLLGMIALSAFLTPSAWLTVTLSDKKNRIKALFAGKGKYVIFTALVGALSYWFLIKALSMANISKVIPIYQSSITVAIVMGFFFLKERDKIFFKLLASIIVVVGAVLVGLS